MLSADEPVRQIFEFRGSNQSESLINTNKTSTTSLCQKYWVYWIRQLLLTNIIKAIRLTQGQKNR